MLSYDTELGYRLVTDIGLATLSQGCLMIQNLNRRGCTLVTAAGVALLNDSRVTARSVIGVIENMSKKME